MTQLVRRLSVAVHQRSANSASRLRDMSRYLDYWSSMTNPACIISREQSGQYAKILNLLTHEYHPTKSGRTSER